MGHGASGVVIQVSVLLAATCILGRAAQRLGVPPTVGELTAGFLLGASVLGQLPHAGGVSRLLTDGTTPSEPLLSIGAFCAVLIVGVAGTSLDLAFVRAHTRPLVVISLTSTMVPMALATAAALSASEELWGPSAERQSFAIFAGLALAVSAIPVIAKILADLDLQHFTFARLALGIAFVDDAVVWTGLSVVAAVAGLRLQIHADLVLVLLGLVVVTVVVGHRAARREAAQPLRRQSQTQAWFLLTASLITLGGALTASVGMEGALGAFLAGAAVMTTRIVPTDAIASLRSVVLGLLAPLFVGIAGLSADLSIMLRPEIAVTAAAAVVIAFGTKFLGSYVGGRLCGMRTRECLAIGACLNARGTVQVIVAAIGLRFGLISVDGYTVLVVVALVTSAFAGPLLSRIVTGAMDTETDDSARLKPR